MYSLIDHTHAAAEILDDTTVRTGLADHSRRIYVGETGKSMEVMGLAVSRKDNCRNIPIRPVTVKVACL